MTEIHLPCGRAVMVDDDDMPLVSSFRWRAQADKRRPGQLDAVVTGQISRGDFMQMHRLIMRPPEGMVIDHINGNVLDNRRQNLRICTVAENNRNRAKLRTNKSGYKGVFWDVSSYRAAITCDGRKTYLGRFATAEAAHAAYVQAAMKLHGSFAHF